MKILVLIDNPLTFGNPYVRTLMQGISGLYSDVEWGYGVEELWTDKCFTYDLIHIHWPDALVWWAYGCHDEMDIVERFRLIKHYGVKLVSTCHNIVPHYMDKESLSYKLYGIVYRESDAIIHLGEYSLKLFQNCYPHATHYLMMHHVYDTIYTSQPSYADCIKALNLSLDKQYILCFGAFRNEEERQLIIQLAADLRKENICFLAPSFVVIPKRRNLIYLIKPILKYLFYKIMYPNIKISGHFVSDQELMFYYGASSISLIHRVHILNSGNLPLGFLMKQVVVGPDKGNVGDILKNTGNPIFDPSDSGSLVEAIFRAQVLVGKQKGLENFKYAMKNWNTSRISDKLYRIYKNEINKNL